MTSVQSLRVWRPSIRLATRAPTTPLLGSERRQQRLFHAGPSSSANNLRRREDGVPGQRASQAREESTPEFKKMRQRVFGDEAAKQLYPETHPRLKPREGRTSISKFRQKEPVQESDNDPEREDAIAMSTIYGRVKTIRRLGKSLIFVTLVNEVETIQGMINQKKLQHEVTPTEFKMFSRIIEKGDHISITGVPVQSSTGDLVIEARSFPELLSPTMEQIPHSITDPETKAQKRHLDMLVNPEVSDTIRLKSHIMQYIRDHFLRDDFLEVQTPILAHNAGGAVARPFVTRATELPNKELSLRVAPELWLKRLVVGGLNKVFEMGPSFRNEGVDATHNPEFTTCEFYSAYTNLDDLMGVTESLLGGMAARCNELIGSKLKSLAPVDADKFQKRYMRVEFVPALEREMGVTLPNLAAENALGELLAVLEDDGIPIPGESVPATLSKLLDRLAAEYLEPFSLDEPIFITNHPACMSPLAKSFVCPSTNQLVSARAELFVDGREIANMYEEENDPAAQANKLRQYRTAGNGGQTARDENDESELEEAEQEINDDDEPAPLDKHYIQAIEAGLPPTGGWGCGVERLVMLFSGANRISDCLTFGTLRNVVGLTADGPDGAKTQGQEKGSAEKTHDDKTTSAKGN